MVTTHNNLDIDIQDTEQQKQSDNKLHPWRICPIGKHFVKKHIEHIPPNKKHPNQGY